jgi:glycerol uptake facilitator-like aquaporin
MFDLPAVTLATKVRTGFGQWLGEFIATFGLVGLIIAVSRRHEVLSVALAVAAFITAGYWFTSSTSFANPAVTIARCLTDTFTGIRAIDAPTFVVAQILGATTATFLFDWLVPKKV